MAESYYTPPHTLTSGPEQWTNGYIVYQFEFEGVPFKLMQRLCSSPEDEEYTYIVVEDRLADGQSFREFEHPWLYKFPPTLAGTITVEAAVQILNMAKGYYNRGVERGHAKAQADIRSAMGL